MSRLGHGLLLSTLLLLATSSASVIAAASGQLPTPAASATPPKEAVSVDENGLGTKVQSVKCALSDISDLMPLENPGTLLPERQALLDSAAQCADSSGRLAPYYAEVLGFIYLNGDQLPNNATPVDTDKARHYLTIAARSGNVLAMAELAELESAAGDYERASVWAYIYDHYSTASGRSDKSGYFPELLPRTYDKIDETTWKQVVAEGNAFIKQNDVAIRAIWTRDQQDYEPQNESWTQRPKYMYVRATDSYPVSVIATFLVGFDKTGSPVDAWLLAAAPNAKAAAVFHDTLIDGRIAPRQDGKTGMRFFRAPFVFDDRRYTTTPVPQD